MSSEKRASRALRVDSAIAYEPPPAPEHAANWRAAEARRLLRTGEIDAGMRAAVRCLQAIHERPTRIESGSDLGGLLRTLRENPLLQFDGRARGYPGDAWFVDAALELAPLPGETSRLGFEMYRWMVQHSQAAAALRARRAYLARCIDESAQLHPEAPVLGLFVGHARELAASDAVRSGRVRVHALEYDAGALPLLQEAWSGFDHVHAQRATLASLLGGRCGVSGCGLIYAPSLSEQLPDESLEALLAVLEDNLRAGGEIVLPAFTSLVETGLLAAAAQWQPRIWSERRLLALARDLDQVSATLEQMPAAGVAFLHLRRAPERAARN